MDSLFENDILGSQCDNVVIVLNSTIDEDDVNELELQGQSSESSEFCDCCWGEHCSSRCPHLEVASSSDSHHHSSCSVVFSLSTITIGSSQSSDHRPPSSRSSQNDSPESDLGSFHGTSSRSNQGSASSESGPNALRESEAEQDADSMDAYFDDLIDQVLANAVPNLDEDKNMDSYFDDSFDDTLSGFDAG